MNIFNKNDNNFSIEEMEKAEILEAYTRKLNGERLSRFQTKLLKSGRYDKELAPLKHLIKQTREAEKEASTEIVIPRPGAKRRVKTKILEVVSERKRKSYDRILPTNPSMAPAPVSPEPVGSDSALEVTVYDESVDSSASVYLLKFKVVEGDEEDREYSVALPELTIDNENQANVKSQRFITIGRGNSAEVQIRDSSCKMSRLHARLYTQNDSVYIEDLDSTNGTYINNVRVTDRAVLSPGSIVKMGGVIIQILSIDNTV